MKNVVLANFFDDLKVTLEQNPYLIYVIGGCLAALLVVIILAVVLKGKKSKGEEGSQERLIKETLMEEEPTPEEESAVEETEEPMVEEVVVEEAKEEIEVKKPATRKPRAKKVEPVVEEVKEDALVTEAKEEPVVEEVVVEEAKEEVEVKKPATRKPRAKKVEEEPQTEEKKETEKVVEKKPGRVVNGKYEVFFDGTSYFYTLKASNGEVLIKSETYASRDSVLAAIEAIKRNINVGTISIRQDKHGLYQFVLVAKNYRTLVMSANYATEARAKSASQSFVRFAETSPVIEIAEQIEATKELVDTTNVVDKQGGKVQVLSDENGFYYILKASNGEMLVHSDYYKTETSAVTALARFKETVKTGKFYVEKDKRDNYQFKLFAPNGRIVCVGEIYSSKPSAISAALSVCSFANLAVTIQE